jgi:hypothetical protein
VSVSQSVSAVSAALLLWCCVLIARPRCGRQTYLTERGNFWVAIDEREDSQTYGQIIGMVGAQCPPDSAPHTDGSVVPSNDCGAP